MYYNCVLKFVILLLVGFSSSLLFGKSVLAEGCDEANIKKYIDQFESKEEFVPETAFNKVVSCGEKSIQPLSDLLESKQSNLMVRVKAVESLGMISALVPDKLKGKIPLLVQLSKDQNENQLVQTQAISVLKNLFVKHENSKSPVFKKDNMDDIKNIHEAADILILSLNNLNPQIRGDSVTSLRIIATSEINNTLVEPIFNALVQIKHEPDPNVRKNIVYALGGIVYSSKSTNPSQAVNFAKQAISYLTPILRNDEFPRVRLNVAVAISDIAKNNDEVITPETITLLEQHLDTNHEADPSVRRNVVYSLANTGKDTVANKLLDVINHDPDERVKWEAISALGSLLERVCTPSHQDKCKNVSEKILTPLATLLNTENIDNNIGINTVNTLGKMGRYAHTSVPQLVKLLNSAKNVESQSAIINSLGNIASNLSHFDKFEKEENFQKAIDIVSKPANTTIREKTPKSIENIENYLKKVQQERTDGVRKFFVSLLNVGWKVILFHAGCWFVLIIFYPRSRLIQTHVVIVQGDKI